MRSLNEIYFTQEEIRFTKVQILFLLWHLNELKCGRWPGDEPTVPINGSGVAVLGAGNMQSSPPSIPDNTALSIARELERRLQACGRDGLLLKARFSDGKSVKQVSEEFGITKEWVYNSCQRAVKYIQGKRKRIDYAHWKGG